MSIFDKEIISIICFLPFFRMQIISLEDSGHLHYEFLPWGANLTALGRNSHALIHRHLMLYYVFHSLQMSLRVCLHFSLIANNVFTHTLRHYLQWVKNVNQCVKTFYNSPACFEVQGKNLFCSRVIKLCITWVNRPTGI